ncbi:MAG: hybrid sensor histidine kinase/response regulator [Gemmatimonadaceae bacterium]
MPPFDAAPDADSLALALPMLDGVSHPIVLLSPAGMVLAVNRPARQLAGNQETVGRLLWDANWGATTEGWREQLRTAVERSAAGASLRLELNVRGPGRHPLPEAGSGPEGGSGHVIEVAFEPWHTSRGVRHVVVSLHDITLRHRAAEELRTSEQRYRLLFERHPLPMWVFDLETLRFLAVNDSALSRYGYSRDEFLEMTIEHIRPPAEVEVLHASISDAGLNQAGVFVHLLRDGTLRQVEIISHSLDFNGRDARLVLAHDVTGRLDAERALREREEQLRHALKMEAVGRLAGGVAHDFNNLLTVISGNLDFARASLPDDSPARADLAEVSAAAERAATLTRQLLAVSRKQLLHPRLLDLGHTVEQAKRLLRRVIGENIVLELVWPSETWSVHADPGQVDQVLLNLVVNARDAMPAGGTITIEVANLTLDAGTARGLDIPVAEGAYVALTVRDTGSGMDALTRQRAVEPFFTTKAAGHGTGLGLSTVYGIITQSGGGLRIESAPGSGTSVAMLLPRAEGTASGGVTDDPWGERGTGETILVVEDETSVRGVIRRTLERHGYTVREARHGGDALLVWARERDSLSLVVTDIVMPELGGRELAARLRAEQPDLPILFLSGYAGGAAGGEPLADDEPFLHKPFAGEELLRQVGALLDRRRQAAPAAATGPRGDDR